MTAAGLPAGQSWSIGAVLARLKPDFPEVTISKIRFLETEGLITPERTPAGYRQFSPADIERLRFVLTAQRDHYLPLKVIKDQLDARSRGLEPATPSPRLPRSFGIAIGPETTGSGVDTHLRMTRVELLAASGLTTEQLRDVESFGLVSIGAGGWYGAEAAQIAAAAAELFAAGLEARHLRPLRTAADREAAMISQMVSAQARQKDPDARERAEAMAAQLAGTVLRLHATLVRAGLRRDLSG
ncbi:MAG: MerR family transcriptional regulator [Nakamurella sp.]